jgi:copper chaperone CopZ
MKIVFLAITLLCSFASRAQINKVTLQASGLTCSMCSNSINKALKSVPYVDKVMANIKTSSFDITFKPGAAVNFDQLKKKVEDAGFFVAKFTANVNFDKQRIVNDDHITFNDLTLHFLNVKDQELSGDKTIQVLDKGYVSAKDFKKNAVYTKMTCYKTGVTGTCCTKTGAAASGTRIYHVTI